MSTPPIEKRLPLLVTELLAEQRVSNRWYLELQVFFLLLRAGIPKADAYLVLRPHVGRESARTTAWRWMGRYAQDISIPSLNPDVRRELRTWATAFLSGHADHRVRAGAVRLLQRERRSCGMRRFSERFSRRKGATKTTRARRTMADWPVDVRQEVRRLAAGVGLPVEKALFGILLRLGLSQQVAYYIASPGTATWNSCRTLGQRWARRYAQAIQMLPADIDTERILTIAMVFTGFGRGVPFGTYIHVMNAAMKWRGSR